jgi:hypothetical protein
MQLRVSLGFARLSDKELNTFTLGVKNAMTGNAAYPSPPVALEKLETARADFEQKVAAAAQGGPPQTAAKNNSRQGLLGMLRQLASYVHINCNNDMATLLSSGFQAMSTNRAQTPLERPSSVALKNGASGQLVASLAPVKNTSMYEGRIKGVSGDWMPSIFDGDSQHIVFGGLTPGSTYTVQVRALGGATGQSDWSDPTSHMAT